MKATMTNRLQTMSVTAAYRESLLSAGCYALKERETYFNVKQCSKDTGAVEGHGSARSCD
jgi:hypothetical protein